MTLATHPPWRGGGPGPRSITHCNTYLLGLKLFSLISRPLAVSSLFELYVCITPVGDSSNRTEFPLQKTALHTLKTTSMCPVCPCLNSSLPVLVPCGPTVQLLSLRCAPVKAFIKCVSTTAMVPWHGLDLQSRMCLSPYLRAPDPGKQLAAAPNTGGDVQPIST